MMPNPLNDNHGSIVDDSSALKTVNLFSDVQDVISKSSERMDEEFQSRVNSNDTEVIDVEENNGNTAI